MAASDVTALLHAWQAGDAAARDRLIPLVYDDLHRRAAAFLRRERPGHMLQPTALVNEAYLRLVKQDRVVWQNRAQFFGGLSLQETTHVLGISVATMERDWQAARAWLYNALKGKPAP